MNRQDRRAKRAPMGVEPLEKREVLSTATDAVVPVALATDVATPTSTAGEPIRYTTLADAPATTDTAQATSTPTDPVLYKLASDGNVPASSPNDGRVYKATSGAATPVATSLVQGISYLYVQGSAHGTSTTVVGNPDVGTTLKLQGKGQIPNLGPVKISGSLHGTGFIASSQGIEGDLKLSNGKGTVTLHLQGPPVKGFTAPGSGTYSFSITGGTGAYKHDFGFGTVDLALKGHSFTLEFHGKPNVY